MADQQTEKFVQDMLKSAEKKEETKPSKMGDVNPEDMKEVMKEIQDKIQKKK